MKIFVYGTLVDLAALGRCAGKPVKAYRDHALLHEFTRAQLRRAPRQRAEAMAIRIMNPGVTRRHM